mmetsp:Transcript_10416/g.18736  ORF Transcript_10416/g.18736 Transcript_10416/m.18736 type:complete len:374 (+) Transcript_10416:35-1156(+)
MASAAVAPAAVLEDGTELAFAPPTFSDSDDEEECRPVPEQEDPVRSIEELRQAFAEEQRLMGTVRVHTHSERDISSLPLDSLEHMQGTAEPLEYLDASSPHLASSSSFAASKYGGGVGQPVLLRGLADKWPASSKWASPAALLESRGAVPLRVTEIPPLLKGFGRPREVRLPLALYMEYTEANQADDPFYAFDHDFTGPRRVLLDDFEVPEPFKNDFYATNATTRSFYPQYRHMIVGGRRTGTNMHIDPKFTCAWNTLLSGRKRWICFPPDTDPEMIGASAEYQKQTPVAYWWLDVYPNLDLRALGAVEGWQRAGETIFVPAGWWHAVLNVDFTIAITQNLVLPDHVEQVLPKLKQDWPEFFEYLQESGHASV